MCGVRFCRFNSLFMGQIILPRSHRSRAGSLAVPPSFTGRFLQKRGGIKKRFIVIMPVFEERLLIGQAAAR